MKTCSFCGTDNPGDAKYCKQCGKALDESLAEPSEREILLHIRTLLGRQVKQGDDIQKELQEYRTEERQYLERAEKQAKKNARNNTAAMAFFIVAFAIFVILAIIGMR